MQDNPSLPSAVCVNHNTRDFRKFHNRFVGDPNVEFRYVPDEGGMLWKHDESADVIAVHCTDSVHGARFNPLRATLVLLDRIDSKVGAELFRSLLSDENYFLVAHESSQRIGYAVFRRDAVTATQPGQRSAA
jgi:hypothetical protein